MKNLLLLAISLTTSLGAQVLDRDWPVELIPVLKEIYARNENASFCYRPVEMVDTVVIHHAQTPTTSTAQEINLFHMNRGTPDDPWYMVAYSYLINAPYRGQKKPSPRVTEGRPIDIVGAHAGSNAFVAMDEEQKRLWSEGKVTCGKDGGVFTVDPKLIKDGKIKANVTTIGVVVIGNYAPFTRENPQGYSRSNPRNPTEETQEMLARLSCQLQKKYPRIRKMKWHNYYNQTTCPGTIQKFIGQIKTRARRHGCEFI